MKKFEKHWATLKKCIANCVPVVIFPGNVTTDTQFVKVNASLGQVRVTHTMKNHNAYKSHESFTNCPSG